MSIEILVLKDVQGKTRFFENELVGLKLAHVENGGFLEDYDDVIKAVEAHFFQDYGVEMHYMVEFDIINQDEICAKFA